MCALVHSFLKDLMQARPTPQRARDARFLIQRVLESSCFLKLRCIARPRNGTLPRSLGAYASWLLTSAGAVRCAGHRMPAIERPQVFAVSAERAVTEVLRWTRDMRVAREIAHDVSAEFAARVHALEAPRPGVAAWLAALGASRVPCALVSNARLTDTRDLLRRLGLADAFHAIVAAEDGMETRSQQLLAAAIKLQRPPNRCVAFVADPSGVTAAHNASARAVAVSGLHPGYALGNADLTCASLAELTVFNLRRLFANSGHDFMDLQTRQAPGGGAAGPRITTRTGIATQPP